MFSRLLIIFAAVFIFSNAVFSQTPTPTPVQDDEPVRVDTEEIKLNVSAFDRFGEFVPEVKKEDLIIVEDGRLLQATSVRRTPANILIVMDTGGELRQVKNITQTRETAKALINKLGSGNSIAVLEYSDKARILTEWTTDKSQIINDLDKKLIFGRRSVFTNALELATDFLGKSKLENRHLVLITDGTDSFWNDERRQTALRKVLSTNINVHVISYTQLELEQIEPKTKAVQKGSPRKTLPPEVIATMPQAIQDMNNAPQIASVNTDKKFIETYKERKKALENGENYLLKLTQDTSGVFFLPEKKGEMLDKVHLIAKMVGSKYVVNSTPKRPLSESEAG
ncbi:MAG: VWA domain-containing protein, partial [Aridibacter sp.]